MKNKSLTELGDTDTANGTATVTLGITYMGI